MNEMIERVARVIEDACAGCDPRDKGAFFDAARAAIRAMREPTMAMLDAANEAVCNTGEPPAQVDLIWQAMIDAALVSHASAAPQPIFGARTA